MGKQYIRKRRFTKVIFVLGLFQLYIWITFKYLIEINPGVEDILKSKNSRMLTIY